MPPEALPSDTDGRAMIIYKKGDDLRQVHGMSRCVLHTMDTCLVARRMLHCMLHRVYDRISWWCRCLGSWIGCSSAKTSTSNSHHTGAMVSM